MEEYDEVYTKIQSDRIASEFTRTKDQFYLEHVGATLYSEKQMEQICDDFKNNLYGNPHAYNMSSKYTEDHIDQIRYLVADHFNTNLDEYHVVFTSGATAALKLVGENFDYGKNGGFMYLEDNHTSVLGMREFQQYQVLSQTNAFNTFHSYSPNLDNYSERDCENSSLFVYPAQCNFSGTKYPLSWIEKVQQGALNKYKKSNWYCMLDAASFLSTNKLDLSQYKPDFVCLSFYKIFGYPTGLGALLVKNSSAYLLRKQYFGGGTAQMVTHSDRVLRFNIHERFEDGTLPFLSIISLRHGFETLKRFNLNMDLISLHSFTLAKYLHHSLLQMHHNNGNPIAILYHDSNFEDQHLQGAIVNFNLLRSNGQYIGYSEVLNMANLYRIHLRTGCFCNPGACQRHLRLTAEDVKQQFEAGHECGDQNDLINNYPTGSVRVSFGYMSRKQDVDQLLLMIQECFISKPLVKKLPENWNEILNKNTVFTNSNAAQKIVFNYIINRDIKENIPKSIRETFDTKLDNNNKLKYIFLYPIKSCGAFSVHKWQIESTGLVYDRKWTIVTLAGVCLTQKQIPRMCLISPQIYIEKGVLELNFPGMLSKTIPLIPNERNKNSEISLCQTKVCGDRVKCFDCGDEIADWLCEALQRSDVRLLQQDLNYLRTNRKGEKSQLSLTNQAQFLLLNTASVNYLATQISNHESSIYNLILRFRPNLVIETDAPFLENSSTQLQIGTNRFKCTGPCTRCQMICIDQTTGQKTVEPLRTLSRLRDGKIQFGQYLSHENLENTFMNTNDVVILEGNGLNTI